MERKLLRLRSLKNVLILVILLVYGVRCFVHTSESWLSTFQNSNFSEKHFVHCRKNFMDWLMKSQNIEKDILILSRMRALWSDFIFDLMLSRQFVNSIGNADFVRSKAKSSRMLRLVRHRVHTWRITIVWILMYFYEYHMRYRSNSWILLEWRRYLNLEKHSVMNDRIHHIFLNIPILSTMFLTGLLKIIFDLLKSCSIMFLIHFDLIENAKFLINKKSLLM